MADSIAEFARGKPGDRSRELRRSGSMTWEAGRGARGERGHELDVILIGAKSRAQLVGVRSLGRAGLSVGVIEHARA